MRKTLLISIFSFSVLYTFGQQDTTTLNKYDQYKKILEKQPYYKLISGSTADEQPQIGDWQKRIEFERLKTLDPTTGEVPTDAMEKAREFVEKSLQKAKSERKTAGIPNVKWKEMGPTNVGGRTRAVMYDPTDSTRSKVWSGGVSGGLWYNNNIRDVNSSWNKVDDFWESMAVSCLASDPTNPKIFYAGTGEIAGGVVQEVGYMWKSEDAGKTWRKLPNKPNASFYMYRIVVNKAGEVFVATGSGIQKSVDGGNTWQTVLYSPVGGATDLEMATDQIMYVATNAGKIYRSNDSSGNQWAEITPSDNKNGNRTELGLALSTKGDNQVIYAYNLGNWMKKSVDAGKNWETLKIPVRADGTPFDGGQGWYDLVITVHPTNENLVYAEGTNISRTIDGGRSWIVFDYRFIHPDHHYVVFNDKNPNETLFSCDGGVYYSSNAGSNTINPPKIEERNKNYNTTQFYSVAIRNIQSDETVIGGTQDNGTWKISSSTADLARTLGYGGDGGYCFIDEDDPDLMIGSYQNGYFYRTDRNNLNYRGFSVSSEGAFINPGDYNSVTNTLFSYAGYNDKIRRIKVDKQLNGADFLGLNKGLGSGMSAFKMGKNNTLLVGTYSGQIYKITDLDNSVGNVTEIGAGYMPRGTINCIEIGTDENELLAIYSNYSVSSVWYTNDGGKNWINKDMNGHGLPNIPVKWAVFNPNNRKQVLVATNLGVWSTNDITANNPAWEVSNTGLANVRCDMIKCRASDGFVVVGTHGRGIFSSYIFAPTSPLQKNITTSLSVNEKSKCAGNQLTVPFTTTGDFNVNESYSVFLSDETGNFKNERLIGKGTKSPIVCSLPLPTTSGNTPDIPDLITGNNYRYRIEAPKSSVSSLPSEVITISSPEAILVRTVYYACEGSSITLKSSVIKDTYSYQWSQNGQKINNGNTDKLVIKASGTYFLQVTEKGCTTQSVSKGVNFGKTLDNVYISVPRNTTCEGYGINASINDLPDYKIKWQKDGVDIPNATSNNFEIKSSGNYTILAQQGTCSTISTPTTISITKNIPVTLETGVGINTPLCRGNQQVFYMYGGFSEDMRFQWQRDGKDIPNAIQNYHYTYTEGDYSLRVTLGKCVSSSSPVRFTYVDEIKNDITTEFNITKMCKGGSVTLMGTYQPNYNGANYYYWKRNGVDIGVSNSHKFQVFESGEYSVSLKQGNCSSNSSTIKVQIDTTKNLIVKLSTDSGKEICNGSNGVIYLPNKPSYPSDIVLSWQKDGVDIPYQNTSYYYPYQSGSYTLTAQKGECKGVSEPFLVNFGNTMSNPIVGEYINGNSRLIAKEFTSCDGQLTVLTPRYNNDSYSQITFKGTYQWQKNGKDIPNATAITYPVTEAGNYSIVMKDKYCTATSEPVKISYVAVPQDITPNISQTICDKGFNPVSFKTVLAENDLVYQWKKNGFILNNENKNTLVTDQIGDYQLIVNRGLCSSSSEVVNILKTPFPKTTFSTNSDISKLCDGDKITLKADKQDGRIYKWFRNGLPIIQDPALKSLLVLEDGKYTLSVDDGNCRYISDTVNLNFLKLPNKFSPVNTELFFCENSSLTLTSIANADTSIKYQWKLNNENIVNANGNFLKISKEGLYKFVATKGACSIISNEAMVAKILLPKASLSANKDLSKICVGQNILLSANKEKGLTYQWFKDNQKIIQATNDSLRASEEGKYTVVTDNGKCANTSDVVNMNFVKVPDKITPAASEQSFCEKSFLILSSIATADTAVKYQWKRNNENIVAANSNALKVLEEGNYQFVATKNSCIANSPTVNIKVTALPKSEISYTKDLSTLCAGDNLVFSGNKEEGIIYQWKKDSVNINNATAQTFQVNQSAKYSLVTSRNNCPTLSSIINVYFNDKPTALISGGTTLYLSESSTLKIDLTSLAPWKIKISDGNEYTANTTPYIINVTPTDSNAYTVTNVNNLCGVGTSVGVVKFKILTPLANEPTLLNEPVLLASSPNPFNESCIIKFGLPKPSNVKIILYDNQGNERMVLMDEKKTLGWHTHTLTSKFLNIGTYILKMEVNGQVFSQKIMLVRE